MRAILVLVLVILLAMLAYLMSLSAHPSITNISPKPGSTTDPGLVTVEAQVNAAKPIESVTLIIDGVQQSPAVSTLGDRSWVVRFQSVMPRGKHNAVVDVLDVKGNHQTQTWSFLASGPRISPSIAFSDPPSDAAVSEGLLLIHANVQSDTDISTATLTVNGQKINTSLTPATTTPVSANLDNPQAQVWNVEAQHAFSAGTYTAKLVATDQQGDQSETEWHFTVTNNPDRASARYFSSAKLYVTGQFLTFWTANNGALLFGDPVSPRFTDTQGTVVQYFEKARFEIGKHGDVSLGLLGDEAIGSTQKSVDKPDGFSGRYFQATGHTLAGKFEDFWNANGGLRIFGYPISEVLDQNGTKVQYFERARFELSKDDNGDTIVRLTPLGAQIWQAQQSSPPT
ncbi:MAG: Ig-like domain-containing protein [Nitrolancea sp.]